MKDLLARGATEHEPILERGEGFVTASVVDPFGNILGRDVQPALRGDPRGALIDAFVAFRNLQDHRPTLLVTVPALREPPKVRAAASR